jgi:serine/threonine-protein kinase RIO1
MPTDTAETLYTLKNGSILNNRFEITALLGEGGFGITYLGFDKKLERKVAIKEFFPSKMAFRNLKDSVSVTTYSGPKGQNYRKQLNKFLREAKRTAQFEKSGGVVNIIDYFEGNNTAYMVMEFLEGKSLGALIEEKGKLSYEETLRIMRPVVFSLRDMHNVRLIHRDIAPDNIMFTDGAGKLIDFGASADLEEEQSESSAIIVKACYVPAEQYESTRDRQGPWTDIYALCATLYKCLTGETIPSAIDRLRGTEVKPLPETIKTAAVIMKGLENKPEDRFQTIDELIGALYPDSDEPPVVRKPLPKAFIIGGFAALAVALIIGALVLFLPKSSDAAAITETPPVQTSAGETTAPAPVGEAETTTTAAYVGNFTYEDYAAKYEHDIANADYHSIFDLNRNCIISPSASFKVVYCPIAQIDDDDAVVMFQTKIYANGKTVDMLDFVCRYTTADGGGGFSEILPEQSYDKTLTDKLTFPYTVEDDEAVIFGYKVPADTVTVELVFTGIDSELTDALTGKNGETIIMKTAPVAPEV